MSAVLPRITFLSFFLLFCMSNEDDKDVKDDEEPNGRFDCSESSLASSEGMVNWNGLYCCVGVIATTIGVRVRALGGLSSS